MGLSRTNPELSIILVATLPEKSTVKVDLINWGVYCLLHWEYSKGDAMTWRLLSDAPPLRTFI